MLYRVENIARKGELLVTSNFSFSHNGFHSYISLVHQNVVLCGNGLKLGKGKTDDQYYLLFQYCFPSVYKQTISFELH